VLAFLLTQYKGKIDKAMNDRFSGVQSDPTLINSLPTDEMAGRSEHFHHDCYNEIQWSLLNVIYLN